MFAADGCTLLTAARDCNARIWNLLTGECVAWASLRVFLFRRRNLDHRSKLAFTLQEKLASDIS